MARDPVFRVKFQQHIPDRSPAAPMFTVLEPPGSPGAVPDCWEAVIADAIYGDRPVFRAPVPRRAVSVQEVAEAAAWQLNERVGVVHLTRWENGAPVFAAIFAAGGAGAWGYVLCVATTDGRLVSSMPMPEAERRARIALAEAARGRLRR